MKSIINQHYFSNTTSGGGGGSSGDVEGPASSTDNAVARYDGTTGKLLQNSSAILADDGTLTTLTFNATSETILQKSTAAVFKCALGTLNDYTAKITIGEDCAPLLASADVVSDVIIGNDAWQAYNPTYDAYNVSIGNFSVKDLVSGENNVLCGNYVAYNATVLDNNILIGANALRSPGSTRNIGIGNRVFYANSNGQTIGTRNIAIGHDSAYSLGTNIGSDNIFLGNYAGAKCAGSNNIILASSSSFPATPTNGNNNISIGTVGTAGENGTIRIGTNGTHTNCYLTGITGNTTNNGSVEPVAVDTNNKLCVIPLSERQVMACITFEAAPSPYTRSLTIMTAAEVQATTTNANQNGFDMPANGRLRLTATSRPLFITCCGSMRLDTGANQDMQISIYVNGAALTGCSQVIRLANTTDNQIFSISRVLLLAQNDYISVFLTNRDGNNGVDMTSFCISAIGAGI